MVYLNTTIGRSDMRHIRRDLYRGVVFRRSSVGRVRLKIMRYLCKQSLAIVYASRWYSFCRPRPDWISSGEVIRSQRENVNSTKREFVAGRRKWYPWRHIMYALRLYFEQIIFSSLVSLGYLILCFNDEILICIIFMNTHAWS